MTTPEESMLPPSKPGSWKFIYLVFALLGIAGLVLVQLYRDAPKASDVIARQRTKQATRVVYTAVLSPVDDARAQRIADEIIADIGADTATTDLVIGSTVVDPWCANVAEYRRMLLRSMRETKQLPIGKQTLVLSMVTGLLTKVTKPSTVYLVGELSGDDVSSIAARTAQTADAMQLRNELAAKVHVVSYLAPDKPLHAAYLSFFEGKTYPLERR
jgi:hypothetical protein